MDAHGINQSPVDQPAACTNYKIANLTQTNMQLMKDFFKEVWGKMQDAGFFYLWDSLTVILVFSLAILAVMIIMRRRRKGHSDRLIIQQILVFLLVNLGIIIFIFSLNFNSDVVRGQVFQFLGIVISAMIALSSATLLGNMLAGTLLRLINSFKPGDYIEVKEYFGRIAERGLFHTEIQTIDSDLITLPNLFLATNPVKVTRPSKTLISAKVSLGYDVPRIDVEKCLVEAAADAGLEESYVIITALGDFSVTYEVYGKLLDVSSIISRRSMLRGAVLDSLHAADIEIVSPTFMNQRRVDDYKFIPARSKIQPSRGKEPEKEAPADPDKIMFDAAEIPDENRLREEEVKEIEKKIDHLNSTLKNETDPDKKQAIESKIDEQIAFKQSILDDMEKNKAKSIDQK
jgi:small-conductance mechanosensitive channel